MDPAKAMQLILPAAVERPDWALPRTVSLCQQAGEQAVTTPLLIVLSSSPDPRRERLVGLLVHGDPRHAAPQGGHGWTGGACRAAAGGAALPQRAWRPTRPPTPAARPRPRAGGRAPGRLLALHKQARREDSELFLPLLADRSWWVRQAAADSLATLPGASPDALQQLLEQVHDRYGRDALRRAIAEVRR